MVYGSLFSGIGGFDLGFDRAGMTCAWQVEIDPYCQRVLKKHWPDVPKHEDIRTFKPTPVDVVCGGFPCQDISTSGKQKGIEGERSGLWSEMLRVISEIRPRFVVVENVEAIRFKGRGLYRVLGDLASLRYDAEWSVVSACSVGSPHMRKRMFIVAYPNGGRDDCRIFPGEELYKSEKEDWRALWERTSTKSGRQSGWSRSGYWSFEPELDRVAHGVPKRVDRLRALGNAVVPQVAEWIGRRLMESSQPQ